MSSRDPAATPEEELRERLRLLTEEVGRNELLLRKTQAREIELLRAHSLGELFDQMVLEQAADRGIEAARAQPQRAAGALEHVLHDGVAMAVAVGYGVVDELHQGHVPGRTPSAADVLTDAFGALLAVAVLRALVTAAPLSVRLLGWLVLACAGSVAFATWGPW